MTQQALSRAQQSLDGLSLGNEFGELCFARPGWMDKGAPTELPAGPWRWTDDTHMALSIVETLQQHRQINQDCLAAAFVQRYQADSDRGYSRRYGC